MILKQEVYSLKDTLSDEGIRAVIRIMRMISPGVFGSNADGTSYKVKTYNSLQLSREEMENISTSIMILEVIVNLLLNITKYHKGDI